MHCLILEDEQSAREVLQSYIDKTPFVHCTGTYESGLDIPPEELKRADVLFLDIQLPELNGLSFLKTVTNPPKVIVTTAYSNYAVEAFEEAVLDYLVKPFSYERFFKAITRARNQFLTQQKEANKQLFLYADKTIYKVEIDEISYLKAEVDYVNVITKDREILISDSLRNWKEKLQDFSFVQVHRSYIINIDKITRVYGNQVFINDQSIPIGKTYKEDFLQRLNS
jgi:DNA-binding LytR/AlgR family response regulator